MLGIVRNHLRVEGVVVFSIAISCVRCCHRRDECPRVIINGQGDRLSRCVNARPYRTVKVNLPGYGAVGLVTHILKVGVSQSQNRAKQGNNKHDRRDGSQFFHNRSSHAFSSC
ncbi:hypothetical protein D3C81_1889430 [compost metagenome]